MAGFFRKRNFAAATVVVFVLALTLACELRLSYSFTFGALDALVDYDRWLIGMMVARVVLMTAVVVLWAVNNTVQLDRAIMLLTSFLTLGVAVSTAALVEALVGPVFQAAKFFILDVALLAIANVLVFSLWYWIIDPPGIRPGERDDDDWEFLFPQRSGSRPQDEGWIPGYVEYLYVSFVVSFTFGPADVMPLSRRAKVLIMIQTTISLIIIAVLAANVITAFDGR
ncbi:MAG: hypothetical protein WBG86_16465 [Polyangiales bacterium]